MTVQLRRTLTQTASRHSAPLPVHEMVFYSLLMTLSANSHGDFHHNVVGSMLPVCALWNINSALLNPVLWDGLQDLDNSFLNLRD